MLDDRVVGDDVINRAILVLRGLAKRSGGFSIQTVPKSGYRLVETKSAFTPVKWTSQFLTVALMILIVAAGIFAFANPIRQGEPPTPSVAVLPFSSGGSPTERSLADAVANSLVHMLSDSALPVQRATSLTAARASADFVVSGDVRNEAGATVVTMQLENAKQKTVLFSKVFRAPRDRSDTLPDQVGAFAAANLTWTGALMILDSRHPSDPKITTELLKQMTLTVEQGDLLRAYEITSQVAPLAPDSAIAQLGLALNTGFVLDQLPRENRAAAVAKARQAARRARVLAPEFADVYLPECLLEPPVPLKSCEDQLRKGLGRNPDAAFVSAWLRRFLGEVGRNREAIGYARMSLANDPYKPGKLGGLIGRLEAVGKKAEAERLFQLGTRWWPNLEVFYWERAYGMAQRGDLDAVADFARRSPPDLMPIDPETAQMLAAAVRSGDRELVRRRCRALSTAAGQPFFSMAGVGPGPPFFCIVALSRLGDLDTAFAIAFATYPNLTASTAAERERRWLDHPVDVPTELLASPALVSMRRDPRFLALAQRVGLLDYWRLGRWPDFCGSRPEPVCAKLKAVA